MSETNDSKQGCGCSSGSGPGAASGAMYPKVTFSTFILSLSSTALVHLGEVPEPESGAIMTDLLAAKHTIDILAMLKDKTSQCLDPDESRLLEGILYDLRMKYVLKKK